MRDIARVINNKLDAEGRVCIEYKDDLTGKVKEQIKGKNYVFKDCLFGMEWINTMSTVPMYITDSRRTIDPDFPLILGNGIGYGYPNGGSSGNYKGAWNSATGFLAQQSSNGITSKFVYDFTPTQALGTIGTIGLTFQNAISYINLKNPFIQWVPSIAVGSAELCVGKYTYDINYTTAVVTRKNLITGATRQVDTSSIVGSTNTKRLGYEPSTGHFYIWVYSSTAADRRMYEFADDDFTSYLNVWSPSNITKNDSNFYVNSGVAYFLLTSSSSTGYISKADFVNNIAVSNSIVITDGAVFTTSSKRFCNTTTYNNWIIALNTGYATNGSAIGIVFDLSTEQIIGRFVVIPTSDYTMCCMNHPFTTNNMFIAYANGYYPRHFGAIAAYKVPTDAPTRPEGYGMTITYELEVLF